MTEPNHKSGLGSRLKAAFSIKVERPEEVSETPTAPVARKPPLKRSPQPARDDRSELDRLLAEQMADTGNPTTAQVPAPSGFEFGMSTEDIYALANVPAVAYPAEQLLRVIAGLASMPDHVRAQTLKALDEADDSWTMGDVQKDAKNKIEALREAAGKVSEALAQKEAALAARSNELQSGCDNVIAQVEAARAKLDAQYAARVAEMEQQKSEANSLLASESARIEAELDSVRSQATKEVERLVKEQRHLSIITTL